MNTRSLALALAVCLPAAARAQQPAARLDGPWGTWEAASATLELRQEEGAVVGRLAAARGPCPLPVASGEGYLELAALNHHAEVAQLRDDPDLEPLRGAPQLEEIAALMSPAETKT